MTGVQYWATHTLSWVNGLPYIRCVVTGLVSEVSEVITEVVCVLDKGNTTRWRCANSVSLTLRVTVMRSPTILILLLPINVVYNTQDLTFQNDLSEKGMEFEGKFPGN